MKNGFALSALAATLFLPLPLRAAEPVDPDGVTIEDAIECRLDAPSYNGFALALNGEDKIADKRHWVRIEGHDPFINEYELPAPIMVAGHYSTRRIAFASSGVLAIIDLADPDVLARELGIKNDMSPNPLIDALAETGKATRDEIAEQVKFRKFLGEKVIADTTELPTAGESFGAHMVVSRNVSNMASHPGKTFYGCSYSVEVIDKDGKPL